MAGTIIRNFLARLVVAIPLKVLEATSSAKSTTLLVLSTFSVKIVSVKFDVLGALTPESFKSLHFKLGLREYERCGIHLGDSLTSIPLASQQIVRNR